MAKIKGACYTSCKQLHHNTVRLCSCPRRALHTMGKGLSYVSDNVPVYEGSDQRPSLLTLIQAARAKNSNYASALSLLTRQGMNT